MFNTLDFIGLGIALLGILIFFVWAYWSKDFKEYAGIKEYKRIRDKLTFREEENEEPEEEEVQELGRKSLMPLIGKMVSLVLALYVGNEIISATNIQINATGTPFNSAIQVFPSFLPIIGILYTFTIIWEFMNWNKEKPFIKGIKEYTDVKEGADKSRRKRK